MKGFPNMFTEREASKIKRNCLLYEKIVKNF